MAFRYGFYNSIDGDRKYDAEQFGDMFSGIITDGIYATIGDAFAVKPGGGMSVTVGTGRCWFDKTWSVNTAVMPLELEVSDLLLPRIDTVIIEVDKRTVTRANAIKVVTGVPAVTPQAMTLTNTDEIHQYPLAYVSIAANQETVTSANIQTVIGQASCPFVTGILKSVDITPFWQQWQAQFDEWFKNLSNALGEDAAGALYAMVEERVKYEDKASRDDVELGEDDKKYVTPKLLHDVTSPEGVAAGEIVHSLVDLSYTQPSKFVKFSGQKFNIDNYPDLASRKNDILPYNRKGAVATTSNTFNISAANPYEYHMSLDGGFLTMNDKLYKLYSGNTLLQEISISFKAECVMDEKVYGFTTKDFSVYKIVKSGTTYTTELLYSHTMSNIHKILPVKLGNEATNYVLIFASNGISAYTVSSNNLQTIDTTDRFVLYKSTAGNVRGTGMTDYIYYKACTPHKFKDDNIYILGITKAAASVYYIQNNSSVVYIGRINKNTKQLYTISTPLQGLQSGIGYLCDAEFLATENKAAITVHSNNVYNHGQNSRNVTYYGPNQQAITYEYTENFDINFGSTIKYTIYYWNAISTSCSSGGAYYNNQSTTVSKMVYGYFYMPIVGDTIYGCFEYATTVNSASYSGGTAPWDSSWNVLVAGVTEADTRYTFYRGNSGITYSGTNQDVTVSTGTLSAGTSLSAKYKPITSRTETFTIAATDYGYMTKFFRAVDSATGESVWTCIGYGQNNRYGIVTFGIGNTLVFPYTMIGLESVPYTYLKVKN